MKKKQSFLIKIFFVSIMILAFVQESYAQEESLKRNNFVLSIGHSAIPTAENPGEDNSMLIVPTWGLSYEFRITEHFVLGLKSEIEASNYIITNEEGKELERDFPISLSLFASHSIYKGFVLFAGGGIEFEESENLFLLSLGVLYEIELPKEWSLVPEFTYGLKGNYLSTYSIALGVGKSFKGNLLKMNLI